MPKELPLERLLYIKRPFRVEKFLTLVYRIKEQCMKFTTGLVFFAMENKDLRIPNIFVVIL